MSNRILIITSGGSQLITQLSTLNIEVVNAENFEITIIYNGVYRKSLDVFFSEVANHYKYKYLINLLCNVFIVYVCVLYMYVIYIYF